MPRLKPHPQQSSLLPRSVRVGAAGLVFALTAGIAAVIGVVPASAATRPAVVNPSAATKKTTTTTTPKKSPPKSAAKGFQALQSCLKAHGVTGGFGGGFGRPGGPGGSGGGGTPTTASAAQRQKLQKLLTGACKKYVPKGGFGFGGRGGFAASPSSAAYRNCLQEHGFTGAVGGFGGRRPGQSSSTTVTPTTTAAQQAALQACAALRPTNRAPTAG